MNKGRVAVIAAASTFTPMSEAGDADREVAPRPGISVLRVTPVTQVSETEMAVVRAVAQRQGRGTSMESRAAGTDQRIRLGSEIFAVADQAGLTYEVHAEDRAEILRSIRGAKQVADFVAFSLHAHESLSGDGADPQPADFIVTFAHEAIDSGADLIVLTGPHVLRGIEIYRGKPIFYGMASLYLQFDGGRGPTLEAARAMKIDPLKYTKPEFMRAIIPAPDAWYDGMVAVAEFTAGVVGEIRITPLRLQRREEIRIQGSPRIARGEDAQRILRRMKAISASFGTDVIIDGDAAFVRT